VVGRAVSRESEFQRLADEHNRRVLVGEMGEPIPDQIVCPLDANPCDDYRCRLWGCLDQRCGHTESQGRDDD
jgi:hypothetical protein